MTPKIPWLVASLNWTIVSYFVASRIHCRSPSDVIKTDVTCDSKHKKYASRVVECVLHTLSVYVALRTDAWKLMFTYHTYTQIKLLMFRVLSKSKSITS